MDDACGHEGLRIVGRFFGGGGYHSGLGRVLSWRLHAVSSVLSCGCGGSYGRGLSETWVRVVHVV